VAKALFEKLGQECEEHPRSSTAGEEGAQARRTPVRVLVRTAEPSRPCCAAREGAAISAPSRRRSALRWVGPRAVQHARRAH